MTTMMRAVVTTRPGGPDQLGLGWRPMPVPGRRQLLVRVRAAALNRADLLQRDGEFPPPAGTTDILGVEIAGDVVAAGSGASTRPGSPVFGLVAGGAYAEYCLIDEEMAIPIPRDLSYVEAAALPEIFYTADTTLFALGGLESGMSVLVHGGGSGLGTACIQMAKSVGARVACTVGGPEKAARAVSLGADLAVDRHCGDFVEEVWTWTKGEGVDLVEDLGGASYFAKNLAVLRDGGCLLQVGVMGGTLCELDLDTIILRRLQIKGSIMRPLSFDAKRSITNRFRERWLPLIEQRVLRPVVDSVFDLSDASRAHDRMEASQHFGKIVLDVHEASAVAGAGPPVRSLSQRTA